jgi:hypothetical protein
MTSTHVRFPRETMERIDAIVGQKRRAQFIRKAVDNELERGVEPPTQLKDGSTKASYGE